MTLQPEFFLAIDQSTSATKAMLFSRDGKILDQETVSHNQIYPVPGWVEHDANQIYENTIKILKDLLAKHQDQLSNILSLSITNQRETFVVFDRETGIPLSNAIVWQCRRGNDICQKLAAQGFEEVVHKKTGLKIDTYFPASKLKWLMESDSELYNRLKDGSALFGTIETYLIYRLTDGKVYATDHTNASRTLFYNIETLTWDNELIDIFDLEFGLLPNIYESANKFGETTIGGLLNVAIPICGVMGDSQAALFAQRCFEPGNSKVTFGTGSSILLNIGHEKKLSDHGTVTALAWVLNGKPTYAYEGIINFTGAIISWLRDQIGLISDPAETEVLARSLQGNDGVYLIPAFVGLSAPYWRADVRAAILGMTPSTTRAHIARAALELIGYIVTDVLKSMSNDANIKLSMIHADGGAVRNTFLMQFVADMNQMVVRTAKSPELSAMGALFNGFLGLGIYNSLDEIQDLSVDFIEFSSSMESNQVNKLYDGWQEAVKQVLYNSKQG